MPTDKDVTEAREREKLLNETYLKGITDFVKWTSTLAVAAILWIASGLSAFLGFSWRWGLSIGALVSLILSLVVAIFAINKVLTTWASEWSEAIVSYELFLFKKLKVFKISEANPDEVQLIKNEMRKKEEEIIKRWTEAIGSAKHFSGPKRFDLWINCHIILLVVGLFLYALAQILHKF